MSIFSIDRNCNARKLQDRCADLHLSISGYLSSSGHNSAEARDILIESIADVEILLDELKGGLDCHDVVDALIAEKISEEAAE
ncbi:hypothetical protein [Methanolobus psychrotolerans]|uniref:hypothetical protein n=1 Tax=Methanolobus psychrotolerans TaxID=1874706 RepID=UPI000B91CA34|nr:hypothetical protein [Methanolobus psychrotolerans]